MDFLREENISALRHLFTNSQRPVVVAHTRPDGDALGSSAALALFLRAMGKDAVCVLPHSPAANLRFMLPPGVPYFFQDIQADACLECIGKADLLILADANAFSRTEGLASALTASPAPKVLMDHHLNPEREAFDLVFSTPDISSASELVYWVLKALTEEEADAPLSTDIGTALMAGMTTDTNNFSNSVYPSTFRMASELLAAGVDRDALLQQLYQSCRENRVRLMGYMQNEQLHLLSGGGAWMVLTQDIQQRFGLQEGESEGLVNIPLSIAAVRLSVLLKEDMGHFRVSVRSKQGTSAQLLAQRYFHGGGHENAAGGKLLIGEDIPGFGDAPAYVERILKEFLS